MSRAAVLTVAARDDLRAELRWIGPDHQLMAMHAAAKVTAQPPLQVAAQNAEMVGAERFVALDRTL